MTGTPANNEATATFGGGCFWCLDAVFRQLRGVTRVESGYAGGSAPNPSYREVCSGTTGHAEVVRVTYDPAQISYRDLLDVFLGVHDPTTLNRQGADIGTQYRSVVLYATPVEKRQAEDAIAELERGKIWNAPVVTEIKPLGPFYPAEEYHQDYFTRNPEQPYCNVVIAPKVAKFRKSSLDRLSK
jgi:peptide-methionine (S)-S-oxide reductase